MTWRSSAWLLAVTLAVGNAMSAWAQCPDGTPPPCVGAVPVARRVNPPLDERTWIVLPFENVTRVADIDWLKDASVNLLYLDMSKWSDIRVIDDERVADLIREVPEARATGPLTLQSGIAVAKRAGAGKLVMGDLLKIGNRTQLVGKVFDVRTGLRVRTVRQDAPTADSIMAAFGLLAQGVLSVGSPSGVRAGGIGTASVGAYQAYIAGVGFLNRWILDSARAQFTRAIQLDSAFALAHYKLAVVYGWDSPGSGENTRHADLAFRLGNSLPARERALVKGYAAFANHRNGDACGIFSGMIAADSTDVEAWYNLGECSYHDNVVVPLAGDSTRFVFRGNWNTMLRAFRKTLELDPTYHLAFQHIQDALLVASRNGCTVVPNADSCADESSVYQGVLRRSGDSLLLIPVSVQHIAQVAEQQLAARRENARRLNLVEALRAAQEWLAAGPNESRPKIAYGRTLLRMGDVTRADSVMRSAGPVARMTRPEAAQLASDRVEIAIKLGNAADAWRLADSLFTSVDSIPGTRILAMAARSMFGRTGTIRPVVEASVGPQAMPWVKRYFVLQTHSLLGAPDDSLFDAETVFVRNISAVGGGARTGTLLAMSLIYVDPRVRGSRWPFTDTANPDPRIKLLSFLARGDTARFKLELTRFDSLVALPRDGPDNGLALASALFRLTVGDTAKALAALRTFEDETWKRTAMQDQLGNGFVFAGMLWPRTFLLLGDLEAAAGTREGAIRAYRTFLGFWQGADPEYQPTVQRVREALRRLGANSP